MPTRRMAGALFVLSIPLLPLGAQSAGPVPRQLPLAQALDLAKQNSPTYLQTLTTAGPAAEAVKQASWARLPTVNASTGASYSGSGSQTFGGQVFPSSPTISSNYSLGATLQVGARTFLAPSIAKAQQEATEQSISAAGVQLTSTVTSQYLNALRNAAVVGVAVQQITRDTSFLALARAKQQVGQASLIDVLQAQTTMATAQVQLLQAQQNATQAKIDLIRLIGLPADVNVDAVTLTDPYTLVEPKFDLDALRRMAHEANPTIRQLQEQQRADLLSVKAARLDRLPTASISTGINGYTQQFTNDDILISNGLRSAQASAANCTFQNQIIMGLATPIPGAIIPDCNAYAGLNANGTALQPVILQGIRSRNSAFPFNFTRQPFSLSLNISVPIWDAYGRSLRISQAEATNDQARQTARAQELQTDAQIQGQLLAVRTAWLRTQIQDSNRVAARQQLQLAQDRYRIGNGTALEILDAQNATTQSEADYVTAVYDYHLAVVGLEAAVGRPLR